jgi:hypothetical protein
MAGDLERFLQQAAERLADKVKQSQQPTPRSANMRERPVSVRDAERSRSILEPEIIDAEIVDAELVDTSSRRALGPNPLSELDTRPGLGREINLADEKMTQHLHTVFDHNVVGLKQASSSLTEFRGETQKSSQLQRRERSVSPLLNMLRNPESLRAAFIASEVFRRKF